MCTQQNLNAGDARRAMTSPSVAHRHAALHGTAGASSCSIDTNPIVCLWLACPPASCVVRYSHVVSTTSPSSTTELLRIGTIHNESNEAEQQPFLCAQHHILWLCSSAISYVHNRPGHLLHTPAAYFGAGTDRECLLGGHPPRPRPDVLYQHHRVFSSSCRQETVWDDLTDMNMGRHLPCKRRCDGSSCR